MHKISKLLQWNCSCSLCTPKNFIIILSPPPRFLDPRERLKEDDLDVVLSPQRRSFGGGCQGNAAPHIRRPISPLENKENDTLRMGGSRRIGSGRIIAARAFEREARAEKEKERERDLKDKRFRVGVCCFQSMQMTLHLVLM